MKKDDFFIFFKKSKKDDIFYLFQEIEKNTKLLKVLLMIYYSYLFLLTDMFIRLQCVRPQSVMELHEGRQVSRIWRHIR